METMPTQRTRRPTPPGEILAELYLAPHEISIAAFAETCGVTRKHMSGIINGHVAITAKMATRIAAALGTTAQYWLNLQNAVDLYDAEQRLAANDTRPQLMPAFASAGQVEPDEVVAKVPVSERRRGSPTLGAQVLALATGRTQREIIAACKGARPNHIGVVISRHKRAGRIEERDGKLYAIKKIEREAAG
jgi:antitoxin HigA-1